MSDKTNTKSPGADRGQTGHGATNVEPARTELVASNGEGAMPASEDVVVVGDGVVVLENFVERNPDVVDLISRSDDRAEAAHRLLGVGAQAAKVVETDLSAQVMERRIDELTGHVDSRVDEFVKKVEALVEEETGLLPTALAENRKRFEDILGEAVDPDKKSSMISKLEALLTDTSAKAASTMKEVLSLDDEDSQLSKLTREFKRGLDEQTTKLEGEIQGVRDLVAGAAGIASEREKGTAKGRDFEDQVSDEASRIAAPHGDVAEAVGDREEVTKKGDTLVHLDEADTFGLPGRFVIEAKNTKLSLRKIYEQLDAGMENRDAQVGIAVFKYQEQAPTQVPFHPHGNKAIVVYDPEGENHALLLGYMWARMMVRQALASTAGVDIDVARSTELVDEAKRGLELAKALKGNHTKAKNAIDAAGKNVDDMVGKVRQALDNLADELEASGDSE